MTPTQSQGCRDMPSHHMPEGRAWEIIWRMTLMITPDLIRVCQGAAITCAGAGAGSCVRQWSLLGPTWTESAEGKKGRLAFQSLGL